MRVQPRRSHRSWLHILRCDYRKYFRGMPGWNRKLQQHQHRRQPIRCDGYQRRYSRVDRHRRLRLGHRPRHREHRQSRRRLERRRSDCFHHHHQRFTKRNNYPWRKCKFHRTRSLIRRNTRRTSFVDCHSRRRRANRNWPLSTKYRHSNIYH